MKNKTIILGMVAVILATALLLTSVSAATKTYSLVCLQGGETIRWSLCNPKMSDYTCPSSKEQCSTCAYIGSNGQLCPATENPNPCNALGLTCGGFGTGGGDSGSGGVIDAVPPTLIIKSPTEGLISNTRKLFLNFSLDEMADVYYRDLNKNPEAWIKICHDCKAADPSYARLRTFAEGENDLMFKAVDSSGNVGYAAVNFFIDSIRPRIYRTYPISNKFANGEFEVQFKELNPSKLVLYYGINAAKTKNVNLNDCYPGVGGKTICTVDVDLSEFNNEQIEYYFYIEDTSKNNYTSRKTKVNVDTVFPKVTNEGSFFTQGEGRYARYISFNISITEENFYRVTYIDQNDPRLLERTLCTRLTYGNCVRKIAFTRGEHLLSIQIKDKAGQTTSLSVGPFTVDY